MVRGAIHRNDRKVAVSELAKTERAYKRFHFTTPHEEFEGWIPNGWPKTYVVIGELERFDLQTNGEVISKRFTKNRPILCTDGKMKKLFIFAKNGTPLGIPGGMAVRVDYRVPAHSGRTRWARRWYHPHETGPQVRPHSSGKCIQVSGSGLSITPEGIVG